MKENKLISEFMGFPKEADAVDDRTIAYYVGESILRTDNTDNENSYDVFHPDDMQFHSSWDWLMSVVEKIFDITFSDDEKETSDSEYFYNVRDCMPDINHTYKAVVEFIKQYNNDK